MRRKVFFDKELPYFMDRLNALQISPEQFVEIYRNYISTKEP